MSKLASTMLAVLFCVVCIVVTVFGFYLNPDDIDPDAYCGVASYPTTLKPIPPLGPEVRKLGLNLKNLDQHIYFRHGDRSTIAAKCFNNVPTHANRVATECPNPVYNFHAGLTGRSTEDGPINRDNYRFSVKPLPNKNVQNGNCHQGQLSQRGVMMSYNNGYRYARYLNFTQEGRITQANFRTRSTDYHRTRETGESFMTGVYDQLGSMYPGPNSFTPQRNIPTFFFVDGSVDALAMNDNMCDTSAYQKEAYADPKWVKYQEDVYLPLQQELSELLKETKSDVYDVFDCTKTLYCHHKSLPEGIDASMQQRMEAALMNTYIHSFSYNKALSSILYTGPWAQETIALITPALASTYTGNLFYINSGHDSNVQAMMQLLKFDNEMWPAYSALFQIELYRSPKTTDHADTERVFARFIYDAEVVIPQFCKDIVIGGELCDAKKFITFLTTALPKNGECKGIPRQAIDSFKQSITGREYLLETEAMDNIEAFVGNMESIHNTKFNSQSLSQEPEDSHHATWAKWAGL